MTLLFACDNEGENTSFSVRGNLISSNGEPVAGAKVTIDDKFNLEAESDTEGNFKITGVAKGAHFLAIEKNYPIGQDVTVQPFFKKVMDVLVDKNVLLNDLTIPDPVVLEATSVSHAAAQLKWSFDNPEFRGFKVYRHPVEDVNEATGALVFSSSLIADTVYTDKGLLPEAQYFYRVYTHLGANELGASNIISITTTAEPVTFEQVILNGSFEDISPSDGNPLYWQLIHQANTSNSNVVPDNTVSSGGNYSLKFSHGITGSCWEVFIRQNIKRQLLQAGKTYKMTFKYKADFTDNRPFSIWLKNGTLNLNMPYQGIFENNVWKDFLLEFTLPSNIGTADVQLTLHFCIPVTGSWWVDDVELINTN